jgi:hypothetical protein
MLDFPTFIGLPLLQSSLAQSKSQLDNRYTFAFSLSVRRLNRTAFKKPEILRAFESFIRDSGPLQQGEKSLQHSVAPGVAAGSPGRKRRLASASYQREKMNGTQGRAQ